MLHGLGVTAESRRPMGRPQIPEATVPRGTGTTTGTSSGGSRIGSDGEAVANVSPEEQEIYNRVVAMAMLAIYDKKMMPKTIKFIEQSDDPVDGVAEIVSQIGMRVYSKAKEKGFDIPGDVMLHAGQEIVEEVINLAEAAGVAEFTPQQAEAAFYAAADKFGQAGRKMKIYSEEQGRADMAELDRMTDAGEFDDMLSQIRAAQQGGPV